jgi:hypothetical protein
VVQWQAELAKRRTTLTGARSGPEPAELAAITTASMALTRGHVRVRALTGQPRTVALFAAALTTISKPGGVWAHNCLDRLEMVSHGNGNVRCRAGLPRGVG